MMLLSIIIPCIILLFDNTNALQHSSTTTLQQQQQQQTKNKPNSRKLRRDDDLLSITITRYPTKSPSIAAALDDDDRFDELMAGHHPTPSVPLTPSRFEIPVVNEEEKPSKEEGKEKVPAKEGNEEVTISKPVDTELPTATFPTTTTTTTTPTVAYGGRFSIPPSTTSPSTPPPQDIAGALEYWYPQRTTCTDTTKFSCHDCIFGITYPGWMLEEGGEGGSGEKYLFDTYDACCARHVCDANDTAADGGESGTPTKMPTQSPDWASPTNVPSKSPVTESPTMLPSTYPTNSPSNNPTSSPSTSPTTKPTLSPSSSPTVRPSTSPSNKPTLSPSSSPTVRPSSSPSPSSSPTFNPTVSSVPSLSGSNYPSFSSLPTERPTISPSKRPTSKPTLAPTNEPTPMPTSKPTNLPTVTPSANPTSSRFRIEPTSNPSFSTSPTLVNSFDPSNSPSNKPTVLSASLTGTPTNNDDNSEERTIACPPSHAYNSTLASTYIEGTQVHVNGIIYQCKPYPFDIYCTIESYRPQSTEGVSWEDAWDGVGVCSLMTDSPSLGPSVSPTEKPTNVPSISPSESPSLMISERPSSVPSIAHSTLPSSKPTREPSILPTNIPTLSPSSSPTMKPTTMEPTVSPSTSPVEKPNCTCAPKSFTIQLDPTQSPDTICNINTIQDNGGIIKTECVWTNANDSSSLADVTPVGIKTRFVGFVELDDDNKVISKVVHGADNDFDDYVGEDVFTFTSISDSLSPALPLDEQLAMVPFAAGLLMVGENSKGEELNGSFIWYYDNSCSDDDTVNDRMIKEGEVFGMITWVYVEDQDDTFCPAIATPGQTPTGENENSLPTCPPPYNEAEADTYNEGKLVEVDGVIYSCNPYPFAIYCSLPNFRPMSAGTKWDDMWTAVGQCQKAANPMEPLSGSITTELPKPNAKPTTHEPSPEPTSRPTPTPITASPTKRPSESPITPNPTFKPTSKPVIVPVQQQVIGWCPPSYDVSSVSTYKEGTEVEVNGVSYKCNQHPFSLYCTLPSHEPLSSGGTKWEETWMELGICKPNPNHVSPSSPVVTPSPVATPPPTLDQFSFETSLFPTDSPKPQEDSASATIKLELRYIPNKLSDDGISIFQNTCSSFFGPSQLDKVETGITDFSCKIVNQEEVVIGGKPAVLVEILVTLTNVSNDDGLDELIEDTFINNSAEFTSDLVTVGEYAGIDDFDELTSITVIVKEKEDERPTIVVQKSKSNKGKAAGWTIFSLLVVGVCAFLLVQRRLRLRGTTKKRVYDMDSSEDEHDSSFSQDRYASSYDGQDAEMINGQSGTPMSVATEPGQNPEVRNTVGNTASNLPSQFQFGPLPPSLLSARQHSTPNADGEVLAGSESMECYGDTNDPSSPRRLRKRTVQAPPGKLGIVIKHSPQGCMIHSVKAGSPMDGLLHPEDIVIFLDDEDVSGYNARQLTMLIAKNVDAKKMFTVLSSKQHGASVGRAPRGSAIRR